MEQYAGHYRGYKIEAELDERWLVRVQPMRPDLPILSFATFRLPREATLFEVIDNARARVDAVLTIGESARESQRATERGDRAT
jgi:hypothetical protein